MATPILSNTRVLENGEVVEIGDYWSVSGNHWTLVSIFHIGDKVGNWPSLTYRRKIKELVTFYVTPPNYVIPYFIGVKQGSFIGLHPQWRNLGHSFGSNTNQLQFPFTNSKLHTQ